MFFSVRADSAEKRPLCGICEENSPVNAGEISSRYNIFKRRQEAEHGRQEEERSAEAAPAPRGVCALTAAGSERAERQPHHLHQVRDRQD